MPVALVTGCSSGFGLLSSIELARAGFRVFATMRNVGKREALDRAAAKAGVSIDVVSLDVLDAASIEAALAAVRASAGGIDVLVNNAGYGLGGFAEDVSIGELREQFDTNFFGLVAVTQAVLPAMRERRSGRIINLSSIGGRVAVPGLSAYCSSKFAVEGWSEALRYECLPFGVHVSIIEPGSFKTDIWANQRLAKRAQDPDSPYREQSDRILKVLARMLEKNDADPEDVSRLVARVARAPRPSLRYLVGKDAWAELTAKTILPGRTFERIVMETARLIPKRKKKKPSPERR